MAIHPIPRTDIVFVFDNLPDWQQLAAGVPAGAQVVVLDGTQDGLAQIAAHLQGREGVDAVHILSHGQPGSLQLGSLTLDQAALAGRADTLAQIGSALSDSGDILLYGCNTAEGAQGAMLLSELARLTQADVAASDDVTGAASQGGDWQLERHAGQIEAAPFSLVDYQHLLVTPSDQDFNSESPRYITNTGDTIAGLTYSMAAPTVGEGAKVALTESSNTSTTGGGDLGLFFNYDGATVVAGAVDARMASADGSEFRIASMEIDTGNDLGTSSDLTITGYRDGVSVASDSFNTGFFDSAGSVSYAKNGVPTGFGGTLTFNSAWNYIDEIRITGNNTIVVVDDLDFEPGIPPAPTITSASYNASTGALVVTGTNFEATGGVNNDIIANKFTLTSEGGTTYTLTDTANVEIGSATSFTLNLSGTDRAAVNQIVNKNGTSSTGGTFYNLAGAAGFVAAHATTADLTGNGITASNVAVPTITSATYDANTGALVVTGTNLKMLNGAANDIVANKFTLRGEGGSTYTLTDTANVNITSGTSFTLTLSATDKAGANLLLNKNGTLSTDISTYNLAAAEDWAAGADAAVVVADTTGNVVLVSNVAVPTITSATYDANTGALVVTGMDFLKRSGASNDIVANKFTFTGEGGSTYTLTDTGNVEITSGTGFTLTLSATDRAAINLIVNKNGTSTTSGTIYNLAAAEDWAAGADAAVVVADLTGNGFTANNVAVPTITSATYDASTGAVVVTGTGFLSRSGASNDIVANKFTFTGEGGVTYTLTDTANVEITSGTSFTITLSTNDKAGVNGILNQNGSSSTGGTVYNLAAAEDWAAGADAAVVVADTTGNGMTVQNFDPPPTVTSINRVGLATTNATSVEYTVTFSEVVTGVDATDFTLTTTAGNAAGDVASITGNGSTYTVTVNNISGNGTLRLDLKGSGTGIEDAANGSIAAGYTGGQSYTIDTEAPTVSSVWVPANATYVAGHNLDFMVNFSESVTTGGTPRIAITLDTGGTVYANYLSGSSTSALLFRTTVLAGWEDANGIVLGSALDLHGGTLKDAVGNNVALTLQGVGDTTGVRIDAIAPNAPSALALDTASDTGTSNSDGITSDTTPTFTGTAEAGSTVSIYDSASLLGTTTADGSGNWSFTPSPLSEGAHTVTATATDAASNVSSVSGGLSIAIDTTAPTTTVASVAFSADTGTSNNDFTTTTAVQTISGTLSANLAADERVQVSLDNGSTWTVATASVGSTSFSLAGVTLLTGSNTLRVRVVDAAGNVGASTAQAYVLDTTAPATPGTPLLASASDTGHSNSDGITNDNTPTFTGTAEANSTVSIYDGASLLGTATANGSGNWSFTSGALSNASHSITAIASDTAGNNSAMSAARIIVVDTAAPTVNTVGVPANATYYMGNTLDFTVQFSESVTVNTTGGTPHIALVVGATTRYADYVSGSGTGALTFRYTVAGGDVDADGITVGALSLNSGSIQDSAGNNAALTLQGVGSTGGIYVNGTPPGITSVSATDSDGSYGAGQTFTITVDFSRAVDVDTTGGTPTLALDGGGTAIYTGGSGTGTLTFSYTVGAGQNSADLDYTATSALELNGATIKDASSNQSAVLTLPAPGATDSLGANKNIVIDTAAPTATVTGVAFSADTGASSTDLITMTALQTLSGTLSANLAAGEFVQISLNNGGNWQTASSVGATSFELTGVTLTGSNTLQVRVVDAAGNIGQPFSTAYVFDTSAPALDTAASTPAVGGTGASIGGDIVLAFTEPLNPAAAHNLGKIYLKDVATDTLVATTVTIDGSGRVVIDPTASLDKGKAYYVTWDADALVDLAGNQAAAVGNETTYHFTTQAAPVIPTPDPDPVDPTPPVIPDVPDDDGIPAAIEDQAPGIPGPGGSTLAGDGNGDGIKDSQQSAVASTAFVLSPTGESNPGSAVPTFTTLVASSVDGKVPNGNDNARITSLGQKDAPPNLPHGMEMPIGLVSFTVALASGRTGEDFSLYVDPALGVNGYWKQDTSGQWVNIASAPYGGKMVIEGGRLRLDFHIEDGGQFDADGKVDGSITDPGAPAHLPLSMVGQAPPLPDGGFWF